MRTNPDLERTGRVTLCDGGMPPQNYGPCLAWRVTAGGQIGISSSLDPGPRAEQVYEGHEIQQVLDAFAAGTVPRDIMDAIRADVEKRAETRIPPA
jgi:hypothetical protein